jgi:GWxTD domain-containing protein
MKITAALFVSLLLPTAPAPPPAVLGTTVPFYTTTRREADSVRVWVGWTGGTRRPPGTTLLLRGVSPTAGETRWQDTVRLRPVGPASGTFTILASRLGEADRLRLREPEVADADEYTDVPIAGVARTRSYALTDTAGAVLTRAWLHTDEMVRPQFFGLETPLTLFRYDAEPHAALPPMAEGVAPPGPAMIKVVETRELAANAPFSIPKAGLYAFRQEAGGPLNGFLVEDGGFPDIRTAPDLIQPLIYLTTAQERQQLTNAPEPKKATDRFWLDVAQGEPDAARVLIRTYYGRVAEANRRYTCHKPGWMTDRGMLLIVLGPPPRVERTPDGEDWVYKDVAGAGGVRFRFRRRPATFAPDQYELRRERGHEAVWYAATAQWRKGTSVTAVR